VAIAEPASRHADAALANGGRAGEFGDRGAGPGTDAALKWTCPALGGPAGCEAVVRRGSDVGAADAEVEQDGCRHDRHRTALRREADAPLGQPSHDAVRGG
jgi:hypothetical protein